MDSTGSVKNRIEEIFSGGRRRYSRPDAEARRLGRGLRRLRARCRAPASADREEKKLLRENHYLLEKESRTVMRELRGCGKVLFLNDRPVLFTVLEKFFGSEKAFRGHFGTDELSERELREVLLAVSEQMELSAAELDILPAALRAVLIGCAFGAFLGRGERADALYAAKALHDIYLIDFAQLACSVSPSERLLMRDPAGVYQVMDDESRAYYRELLARRARLAGMSETAAAEEVLRLAEDGSDERERHVGFWLMKKEKRHAARGWLALLAPPLLSAAACISVGLWLRSAALALLLFLPLWETLRPFAEWLLTLRIPSAMLPAIDLERAGCRDCETVVVISTLVPKVRELPGLEAHLRQLCLANELPGLHFCVLADLREAASRTLPDDGAKLSALEKSIGRLNAELGGRFSVFLRSRSYSRTQDSYCGRERKRGALTELARYIGGSEPEGCRVFPDGAALRGKKRMIVLDADTLLLFDTAEKLIGASMHILNRPVIDPVFNVVTQGFGVIVPRLSVSLESAKSTFFAQLMAGLGGVTPYDVRAREFYQDMFGASLFCGKGLIDVETFCRVMEGRLPKERVLSHDVVEGEYLRTAFLSRVELSEGFPADSAAWHARLHRWTRGDWQNLFLLGRRELGRLSRYKLADNLRRSLTAPAALACVVLAAAEAFAGHPELSWAAAAAAALPFLAFPAFSACISLLRGGIFVLTRRYFSDILPQTAETLLQAAFSFLMLPRTALVCADAAARALWRVLFSGKRLLQWVTAADSSSEGGAAGYLKRYSLPTAFGLLLVFAPSALLRLYGLIFLLTAPAAALSARRRSSGAAKLSEMDRDFICGCAAKMWRFFEEYAGAYDNWLPPDNVQQAPVYAVAHRTSPTNIGLAMLCTLAACDFDLIDSEGMRRRLARMLDSVERLKKWRGNLYNWYDTTTLEVLEPAFVSAVDSGNFICCMVALREGVRGYAGEAPELETIAGRIGRLIDEADVGSFYDRRRRLFSIGYDPGTGKLSRSFYDFLMSEARMTSYYAIASRRVEKRHWAALSRTMSRSGLYAGPISWTGTMFEYYMPSLLLPGSEGSLLSEGLRYSYYCQRKRVGKGMPWGISESAFYSFDRQLCYQYKAHGVQKLGAKRGLDRELVISPYSSFLTLPFHSGSSIRNLKLLQSRGMDSEFGFFEAMDLTKGRTGICRSHMAHHVGMSMAACANAVFDGVMQRRFMADPRMTSACELLEERPDRDAVVFDDVRFRDVDEIRGASTGRGTGMEQETLSGRVDPDSPTATVLSNGAMCDILSDTGENRLMLAQSDLTRRTVDSLRSPQGIYVFAAVNGRVFSLTEAPFYEQKAEYGAEMSRGKVKYLCRTPELDCSVEVMLHAGAAAEQRAITVRNVSGARLRAELLIWFEPVLRPHRDYEAHPAFSKLFVRAERDEESGCVVFSRRARGSERGLSMAAGFLEETEYELETRRERLFCSPNGFDSLKDFPKAEFSGGSGVPDCCFAARLAAELSPGQKESFTLLMTAGASREECTAGIMRLRREGGIRPGKNAAVSPLFDNTLEGRLAFLLLPRLLYPMLSAGKEKLAARNVLGRNGLWALSISGDLPLVGCDLTAEAERREERLRTALRVLMLLRERRVEFDLAVLYRSSNAPGFAVDAARIAGELGCGELINARCGAFFIDADSIPDEQLTLLRLSTICNISDGIYKKENKRGFFRPAKLLPVSPADIEKVDAKLRVSGGAFTRTRFYAARKTPLPYCHVLAGPAFGTLVSDGALGFSWAVNSRENKLTPWSNDFASGDRGELMLLRDGDGRMFDLAFGALFSCSPSNARWEGHIGGLKTMVEVSLPEGGACCCKALDVTLINVSREELGFEAAYYAKPVLAASGNSGGRYIKTEQRGGTLLMKEPMNTLIPGWMALGCSREHRIVLDRAAFLAGRWDAGERGSELCGALVVPLRLPPGRKLKIRFILAFAAEKAAAELLARSGAELAAADRAREPALEISTPDKRLDAFMNGWCLHQARAGRMFARTSFWQNGGAYGFRDQLQDACCLAQLEPKLLQRQIYRACAVQFTQGDVLHWWHRYPGCVRGVRTRISDDLLWLPYAVCEYLEKTGDKAVLDVRIAYLEGEELDANEKERYFAPERSGLRETVYQHCLRALERAKRLGAHGLPLIGAGDWNDSFSSVGARGCGESVWLAMFMRLVAERFAGIARTVGDDYNASALERLAERLGEAVESRCWDGGWYLRAFYDDGEPMGGAESPECSIDLLSQSFAALSGVSRDPERLDGALSMAMERLTDEKTRTVRLFTPPFEDTPRDPGYVKAYPPGIRENGGQYTHAAIWLAMALMKRGRGDEAYRILDMLDPVSRCADGELNRRYMLEPYYIAADIYAGECAGRGGWSLYTGAAGWYLRAVSEWMLGLKIRGDRLLVEPVLPGSWNGFCARLRRNGAEIEIEVRRGEKRGLLCDGREAEYVPLDGRDHSAVLTLG